MSNLIQLKEPLLSKGNDDPLAIHQANSKGLMFMVWAIAVQTIGFILGKLIYKVNPSVSTFEIITSRALVQVIFNELLMKYFQSQKLTNGSSNNQVISYSKLSKRQVLLLSLRLLIGYPSWLMVFYSLEKLPVGLIQTIQNLIPFLTLISSYFILKETLRLLEVLNMLFSFMGVLLMIYLSTQAPDLSQISTGSTLALALCILSSFLLSLLNVIMRMLKDIHFSVSAGFQSTGTLVASVVTLIIYRTQFSEVGFNYSLGIIEIVLMIANGLVNSVAQILFIKAFQTDKAGRAAGLQFLSIVFGYLSDALIFQYTIQSYEIIGASMIIMSSILMFIMKYTRYSQ